MGTCRGEFVAPFCPNERCVSHADAGPWRYRKKGFFVRPGDGARIQRYLCSRCGRSFSPRTFSATYWLRHRGLLETLFFRLRGGMGLRPMAQELGLAPSTLQRQAERLGRHCLLLHEELRPRRPSEPVVLDGFRTFEAGQYWPFDLNLVVGVSHFVYGFNDAELRRSGTMTRRQRRRREALERAWGRPDPQATRRAVTELVGRLVPEGGAVELRSDAHTSYPPALRALPGRRIRHVVVSSREARTAANPLFPANLADLLLRHTGANHRRETIAFSKRRLGALLRAAIFVVWRNYVKGSSERRRSEPPGVTVGAIPQRLAVAALLERRRFPWRQQLPRWVRACYEGRIFTRARRRQRVHALRYAF
jgi:transposase-like protein